MYFLVVEDDDKAAVQLQKGLAEVSVVADLVIAGDHLPVLRIWSRLQHTHADVLA